MTSAFGPHKDLAKTTPSSKPFLSGRKPLDVIIVGGSHSGLFIAILLKRQGHNIRILESVNSSARSGLGAGITQAAYVKQYFEANDKLKHIPFGVPSVFMNVVNPDLTVKNQIPVYFYLTSWDATYYRLRANYDALRSEYCPNPPPLVEGEGEGVFETGKKVLEVEEGSAGKLRVVVEDVETSAQGTYEADAVIAADGANSTVRKQMQHELEREESGYVLWRGTVVEKAFPASLLEKIEGHTTLCPIKDSYTITYIIPGENGSLEPGHRHVNFAWYTWPSQSCLTISEILTDTDGHTHRTTLPKGKMRPEIWDRQLEHAKKVLPDLLCQIITKIQFPFVSVISNQRSPKASYFDKRLFLVGDALAQTQPNTGQGTNLAAMDAMLLARVFGGEMGVEEWEREVLETATREKERAVEFAGGWLGRREE